MARQKKQAEEPESGSDEARPAGQLKYPNEPEPLVVPEIAEDSVPTSPTFVYDSATFDKKGRLTEDRRLEKHTTIRSPTQAEQAAYGAPGITISGKHQEGGQDYVQGGGDPGQISYGMTLGKAGHNDEGGGTNAE